MWGVGGLTWGLMIRYLGVGLGLAIGCGLSSAAGTLVPPILDGRLARALRSPAARCRLAGVVVSILGIILVGMAGMSKEKELPEEEKKKAVAEYDFKKGILVAVFSGLMSAAWASGSRAARSLEAKAQYGSLSKTRRLTADEPPLAQSQSKRHSPVDARFFRRDKTCVTTPTPSFRGAFGCSRRALTTKAWAGCLCWWGVGRRFRDQLPLVPLSQPEEQDVSRLRSGPPVAAFNVFFAGLAGAIWCSNSSSASRRASRRWATGPTSAGPC